MDPIAAIDHDRRIARTHEDANADICFLALSENGQPSVRTLVLREISEQGLVLFINRTSAKWRILSQNKRAELLLWLPSLQKQYRVAGRIQEMDRSSIEKNWPRRPAGSKYLDHSYGKLADQSSPLESRRQLLDFISELRAETPESSLQTPDSATGILLTPDSIECLDLNRADRIHDRRLYTREGGRWTESQLMP